MLVKQSHRDCLDESRTACFDFEIQLLPENKWIFGNVAVGLAIRYSERLCGSFGDKVKLELEVLLPTNILSTFGCNIFPVTPWTC